jgi:UDP-N-acetylglucosamine--N-acetylmuramyl-(pentapeptide) pyrophosphoryl-undecaprenol N-acetylglucosamine transferase
MRIVFVGGGTGGHFYPLIAIAEALIARAKTNREVIPELFYMGPDPYDEGSLYTSGITFVRVPAGKMRRYASFKNVLDLFAVAWGILIAILKLFVIYPDVVMSKGGYTSVPVVIAAWLLRIPIVVHESDAVPGRANKIGARFARYIAITYDDSVMHFPGERTAQTGIPVRQELLAPPPGDPRQILGLKSDKPLIFITGGSQGAERINDLVISALRDLLPQFEIFHQTGAGQETVVTQTAAALIREQELLAHYHVRGFVDAKTLHAAETTAWLIISRAGSGSIYEIALHGKPSIIIPIPEEISHDQRTNAYAYARTGAALVIEERNMTPHLLVSEITRMMNAPEIMEGMRKAAKAFGTTDAAAKIADMLVAIGRSHGK